MQCTDIVDIGFSDATLPWKIKHFSYFYLTLHKIKIKNTENSFLAGSCLSCQQ